MSSHSVGGWEGLTAKFVVGTERSGVTVTNWQDFGGWGGCGLACRSCLVAILVKNDPVRNFERPPSHPALFRQRVF